MAFIVSVIKISWANVQTAWVGLDKGLEALVFSALNAIQALYFVPQTILKFPIFSSLQATVVKEECLWKGSIALDRKQEATAGEVG